MQGLHQLLHGLAPLRLWQGNTKQKVPGSLQGGLLLPQGCLNCQQVWVQLLCLSQLFVVQAAKHTADIHLDPVRARSCFPLLRATS
ncbi:unnamed protein product [Lampetra fluviatilis]